jgi:hypothetical protein
MTEHEWKIFEKGNNKYHRICKNCGRVEEFEVLCWTKSEWKRKSINDDKCNDEVPEDPTDDKYVDLGQTMGKLL